MKNKSNIALAIVIAAILSCFVSFHSVSQNLSPSHFRLHLQDGKWLNRPVEQVDSIKYLDLSSEAELSVTLQEPGTLSNVFEQRDHSAVIKLKISGTINQNDLLFIHNNLSSLQSLDMEDCVIEYGSAEEEIEEVALVDDNCDIPAWFFACEGEVVIGSQTLRELKLPAGALTIGEHAFENAAFMRNLTLPESLTSIGAASFNGCHSISSLVLPSTLTEIGDRAFCDNYSLRRVTVTGETVPELGDDAFLGIYPGAVLTVPQGKGKDYLYSPWSYYFRIFEDGEDAPEINLDPINEEIKFLELNGVAPTSIDNDNGFILFSTQYIPEEIDLTNMTLSILPQKGYSVSVGGEVIHGVLNADLSSPLVLSVTNGSDISKEIVVAMIYGNIPTIYVTTKDSAPIVSKEEYLKQTEVCVFNSANDSRYTDASIKGRGNSSWTLPKKPYTVKLNKKDKFAGFPKHKTFALVANYSDKTLLRNALTYEMARDIFDNMSWNPNAISVHLVVNGEYEGVYTLTESAKIDTNRIDIPNIEDCKTIDDADKYGFLIEANQRLDENLNITTSRNNKFSLKEPDGADLSDELKEYITQKLQQAEDILYSNASEEDENYFGRYFDLDSFVDWYLVNEISKNQDARYGNSCFLYYNPTDGLWHAGPVWDFDIAYGNINYGGTDTPEDFYVNTARWPMQFFKYPEFVEKVKARWIEKKDAVCDFFLNKAAEAAKALEPEATMNFNRWDILGTYVWPNPAGYDERNTYQSEFEFLLNWVNTRIEWLDRNINEL